ncbi:MAG TPA: hypothetical protein VIU61_23960 [Kofleriaceae bacterium]
MLGLPITLGWIVALLFACSTPAPVPSAPGEPAPTPTTTPITVTAADVTMIWPMPRDATGRDAMIAATAAGGHGELLPASHYKVPVLDARDWDVKEPQVDRTRLRVVAARLDPCFASFVPPTDASCVNQVRLVMQVIRSGGAGVKDRLGANDGAVHAFYRLPRAELLDLVRELAALGAKHGGTASETLGVHPILARDGAGSEYGKQLHALLLARIGVKRLVRVTFFARTADREPLWPFGLFDVIDGKLVEQDIVTLGAKRQTLEGAGPLKVIAPQTASADNPAALLTVRGPARTATDRERAAYAALLRIQNPTKHTPDTMACAECHAAQRMQRAAEITLGLRATDLAEDYFATGIPLPATPVDAENFHAAGYLGDNLAVSVRTANETAAVVAALTALLGG